MHLKECFPLELLKDQLIPCFLHPLTEIPELELADDLKKTVTVRAGGSLRLMVSVSGRPTPVITWSKQGVDLVSRAIIDTTDSYTLLIVDKVNRYDAGKYIIEAENQSGKKSATISVKVYGKSCYNCITLSIAHISQE